MRLADYSLRKMAFEGYECSCGKRHGRKTELRFSKFSELKGILEEEYPSHKALFVFDFERAAILKNALPGEGFSLFLGERAEINELFAFPETVTLVVVCGGERTLSLARYFCAVRSLPCVAVCSSTDAAPLLKRTGQISLLGKELTCPLAPITNLFFLEEFVSEKNAASVFLRLAVRCLSLVEKRFESLVLGKKECDELFEVYYDLFLSVSEIPRSKERLKKLFEASYRFCFMKEEGFFFTECEYLWDNLSEGKQLFAFTRVGKLFSLFFSLGGRRKFCFSDYGARFEKAAALVNKTPLEISESCPLPTGRKLLLCEKNFLREKGKLLRLSKEVEEKIPSLLDGYCLFGGVVFEENCKEELQFLPECSGRYGVFSLMRDFGLLKG